MLNTFLSPELLLLGNLCAVLGTALCTVGNTLGIQSTADNVVTYTGQVSYSTASDEDNGVLLQVVADTGDIHGCLKSVGQSYSCDLTHSRVRLLRACRGNLCANTSLLGRCLVGGNVVQSVEALLQHGCLGLIHLIATTLSDELVKGWHTSLSSSFF